MFLRRRRTEEKDPFHLMVFWVKYYRNKPHQSSQVSHSPEIAGPPLLGPPLPISPPLPPLPSSDSHFAPAGRGRRGRRGRRPLHEGQERGAEQACCGKSIWGNFACICLFLLHHYSPVQTTRKGKRTLSYPSTKAATEEEEESELDSDSPPPSEVPSPSQRLSLQLN